MHSFQIFTRILGAVLLSSWVSVIADERFKPTPPLLPIERLGKFEPIVREIQEFHTNKKYVQFYKKVSDFLEKKKKDEMRSEEKRGKLSMSDREESMTMEWIFYFVTSAPLIEHHEYLEKNLVTLGD